MTTPEENKRFTEELDARLRELEDWKKETESKIIPEKDNGIPYEDILKTGTSYLQLPIFTSLPTHDGREGELIFVDEGTYYYLCVYKDSAWQAFRDEAITYVEVAEGGVSGLGTSTWTDWDLSAIIPANAKIADISMVNRTDAEYVAGVRENGSSQERKLYINNDSQCFMTVNLDSGRVIERYSDSTDVSFAVRGYWI